MWEWIFGEKPYSNPAIGDVPVVPTLPPEFQDLQNWLLKSVATRPEEGFGTIDEMWRASMNPNDSISQLQSLRRLRLWTIRLY